MTPSARPVTRRVALILGAALIALTACSKPKTDEDRVRDVVQAVVGGAVDGDVGSVMQHVSGRYQGDSIDYDMLHAFLVEAFLRRGPLVILPGPIDVTVTGDSAHASFNAAIAEGKGKWGDLVDADGWHLEVDFAREGSAGGPAPAGDPGEWRVVKYERQ